MSAGTLSPIIVDTRHGQGFTEVVFRRRGRWASALMLLGVVAVWLLGMGFAALLIGANVGQPGMVWIWLALWGAGGLAGILYMLWRTIGIESLIAKSDSLTLMRRLVLLALGTSVPAKAIHTIGWLADDPAYRVTVNGRRIPQSAIAIAAEGPRHLRCAHGIAEAEAETAIAALKMRLVTNWKPRR